MNVETRLVGVHGAGGEVLTSLFVSGEARMFSLVPNRANSHSKVLAPQSGASVDR